jgi:hypothetical protein
MPAAPPWTRGEDAVILRCTFEELTAVSSSAQRVLAVAAGSTGRVWAPPEVIGDVEGLLPRLTGDITVHTLSEQRSIESALFFILEDLRERMDSTVLTQHVGAEEAVIAYFDYANVLTLYERARRMGQMMAALIELMTGAPATERTAREMNFGDDYAE